MAQLKKTQAVLISLNCVGIRGINNELIVRHKSCFYQMHFQIFLLILCLCLLQYLVPRIFGIHVIITNCLNPYNIDNFLYNHVISNVYAFFNFEQKFFLATFPKAPISPKVPNIVVIFWRNILLI
jgi:hypothetical protein